MPTEHNLSAAFLKMLSDRIGWGIEARQDRFVQGVSAGVAALSKLFTTDRHELKPQYLCEDRLRLAYLCYFLPVNAAKIQAVLDELPEREIESEHGPLRVLDLGSGPGTAALAVLDWMQRPPRRDRSLIVTALDGEKSSLGEAEYLWDAYCRANALRAQFNPIHADLERSTWLKTLDSSLPFDLIILVNTLNELHRGSTDPVERHVALIETLLGKLDQNGALMIVEPALRQTSRNLHQVRDRLVAMQRCTVYSPCLHEHPCPALVHPDDWCHEERLWAPPPWIARIDREVGFIKDALKFSYLVLRKDGATIVPRRVDVFRVVSELRSMKGDTRAWLCNETGRPEVGRLDREETESNASVRDWHRGAIVQISGIEKKNSVGLGRIRPTASVRMIRPA